MKLVKAMAIVFFLAMGAALNVLNANAQSPSPTPATVTEVGIPEKAPQYWIDTGGTQGQWTAMRQRCDAISTEMERRNKMKDALGRGLPPPSYTHEEVLHCQNLSVSFAPHFGPLTSPGAVPSGVAGTPRPTPLPAAPAPPVAPQTFDPPTSASPSIGTDFVGAGASACPGPSPAPNVFPATQPLDVAADVSGTQNVEMLNQGIFIYDKSGNLKGSESLYQFWCQHPGANGQTLPVCSKGDANNPLTISDTQIAFDSFESRWVASTLVLTGDGPPSTAHDLLFAVSTGTSALDGTGAWDRYDFPVCTGTNPQVPDQPILGYNSNWVAVDTLCIQNVGGKPQPGLDALTLIPQSSIANPPQTLSPTIINPPAFASRPARDVSNASGAGYPSYSQLVLASSQFSNNNSSPPFVSLYGIGSPSPGATPSPTFIGNSPNAWGFSGGGTATIPPAPQSGCSVPSSNCMIDAIDQDRIQQVTLQYNQNTKKHYLLTSFTAGYLSGAEALYYLDELETGTWAGQWTGTGNTGWVPTYTTFASDQDFDIDATLTSFTSSSAPFSVSLGWHEFPQMFGVPESNFATSAGVYTGKNTCPSATPTGSVSPTPTPSPSATPTPAPIMPRWGDYNSLIWDPSLFSSSGEPGLFWSVAELSQGGSDQSTVWTQFNDTLPYFVGPPSQTSQNEAECSGGTGSTCKVTVTAPSGIQVGDVVLVALLLGEPAAHPPGLPDNSSWTLLSASNITGNPTMIASGGCSGTCVTAWLAAHIYTSSDSGSYTFSHYLNSYTEMGALLAAYRGGGQTLANYKAYGFTQNGISSMFSTKAVTPPAESTLAAFVAPDGGCDTPESAEATSETVTAPTGTPALTPETSLTNFISSWIEADAGVPNTGQAYGPYTLTESQVGGCQGIGAIWLAWEVAIPEQ